MQSPADEHDREGKHVCGLLTIEELVWSSSCPSWHLVAIRPLVQEQRIITKLLLNRQLSTKEKKNELFKGDLAMSEFKKSQLF
jgi:hypothetical protein